MRTLLCSAALLALLLAPRPASAQLVYEFADGSGTAQTSFSVAAGSSLPIQVYIHELTAGAPMLNSDGGLGTGAVRVTFNAPSGVAAVRAASDIAPATPPWSFGVPGLSPTSATLSDLSAIATGVPPDAQGRVLLGTFTFQGLSPGTATLTAVDPNPAAGFDTSSFAIDADSVPLINYDPLLVAGSATIVVTPEPTTGAWFVAAAGGGLVTVWRRRARAAPPVAREAREHERLRRTVIGRRGRSQRD